MPQLIPTLLLSALTVIVLWGMWASWKRRSQNDAHTVENLALTEALQGNLIAEFAGVQYVSTTVSGEPLVRFQVPGLRYRGFSNLKVHTDGLVITVNGEKSVNISESLVLDTGTTQMRVGKVVEKGGLAGIVWRAGDKTLESVFRFPETTAQKQFLKVINETFLEERTTVGEN